MVDVGLVVGVDDDEVGIVVFDIEGLVEFVGIGGNLRCLLHRPFGFPG